MSTLTQTDETRSVDRSVDRLGAPTRMGDSLDQSYVRTNGRTDAEPYSPTADTPSSVSHARTYGFPSMTDAHRTPGAPMAETCDHREWTRHFEWKCDQPAGHGGRGHVLVMVRRVEEGS